MIGHRPYFILWNLNQLKYISEINSIKKDAGE